MDPRSRAKERSGREMKSVLFYVQRCLREHKRRQELFSQRWVGADYFHEYLSTIEPYSAVLATDMEDLIKTYLHKGRKEFKNCDHRITADSEKQRLSELVTKYIIEENAKKSGFQIGILELVRVHPFQIAQELRVSRVRPVGELNRLLPKCLAFGGGIHLIPETEEWEPMAVLWKIWKSSVERFEVAGRTEEYVNLHYRSPSHIDRNKCMQDLDVQCMYASKVLVILRKAVRGLTGSPEVKKQDATYCFEILFPSFSESICDFYVKHSSFAPEKTNRRKTVAATLSNKPGKNSGTMAQTFRNSFRSRKQPSACSPSQSTTSKQDVKSQNLRTADLPATRSKRDVISPDGEKLKTAIENSEPTTPYFEEAVVVSQEGIVITSPLGNLDPRSGQISNGAETIGTPSAMSTFQTSHLGESRLGLCDSPEISSASRNSPAMPTLRCSNYISKTDAERTVTVSKQREDANASSKIMETPGLRRNGTVTKRPAPKKAPGHLPGGSNQFVHTASSKTVSPHKEADPSKLSKDPDDSEQSSLSTRGQNTHPLSRKQSKKPKTMEYFLKV